MTTKNIKFLWSFKIGRRYVKFHRLEKLPGFIFIKMAQLIKLTTKQELCLGKSNFRIAVGFAKNDTKAS